MHIGLINHTLQRTRAGTQDVRKKLTAGKVVQRIDKEERGGSERCESRHGYVGGRWWRNRAKNFLPNCPNLRGSVFSLPIKESVVYLKLLVCSVSLNFLKNGEVY